MPILDANSTAFRMPGGIIGQVDEKSWRPGHESISS